MLSYEVGRDLGGGSLSRPKTASGVRAVRKSELRRDDEVGDAEAWVGKSKQSCLGWGRRGKYPERRGETAAEKCSFVFALLQRHAENPFITARSKVL